MANTPATLRVCLFGLIGLFFTACGVYRESTAPAPSASPSGAPVAISAGTESSAASIQDKLFDAHSEWKGIPYRLGGNNRQGVDCSAFIQIVYRDFFGMSMPRHTRDQLQEGSGVRRNGIRPGDLVFFRTNRGVLHVGIAMEDGDFLHASVSSGVMISNIGQNYWASRYLGARRIF